MFSVSCRNSFQEEPFTIASPHVVYRSNWLERTPEIENLLSKTVRDLSNLRSSDLSVEDGNTTKDIILRTLIFPTELREIEMFFYLFMKDLAYKNNLYQAIQSISSVEKIILASLFLNRNQINEFIITKQFEEKRIPTSPSNEYSEDLYSNECNWKISLPNFFESLNKLEKKEDGTWLEEELDGLRWISYIEKINLKTKSYYYISKGELMERVRYLLCKGLFNNEKPKDMFDIEVLYDRLLSFRGAVMWMTASNQFPNDEVTFLWNRSMIGQSLEEAWHLLLTRQSLDKFLKKKRKEYGLRRFWLETSDSVPNFKVTHHNKVKHENRLVSIIDVQMWTNDQLRDVLGCDWMFDQRLVLEDNWMNVKKETDFRIVREKLFELISSRLPVDDDYQEKFLTRTNNNQLFLEEFNPIKVLRKVLIEQGFNKSIDSIARTRLIPDFFIGLSNNPNNSRTYIPIENNYYQYYQLRNELNEIVEDNLEDVLDDQIW